MDHVHSLLLGRGPQQGLGQSVHFFFFAKECVKEMNINGFLLILGTSEQSSLCYDFFLYVFSFAKYSWF